MNNWKKNLKKWLKKEEEVKDLIPIYLFESEDYPIRTSRGTIPYLLWLILEADRISQGVNRKAAIVQVGKKYALFVNDVGDHEKKKPQASC